MTTTTLRRFGIAALRGSLTDTVVRHRRKLAALVGVGLLLAGTWVWWWHYSGSVIPLTSSVDAPVGRFTLAAEVPIPRTEAGGAACDGRFYLVGGIGGFAGTFRSVMAYDPAADAWSACADLPRLINHPGVTSAGDRLHVVGGFGPLGIRLRGFMFARWDPLTEVWIYNREQDSWDVGPPLPEARGAGGVAATDDAIWYVGGIAPDLQVSDRLYRLNLATGTWEERAPMPTARDHLRLEAVGGALYAISGRKDDLRHNFDVVERYDIATDTWSTVAPIPRGRGGLGSAVVDGMIYTFGGEFVWTCFDTVERYDPEADRWDDVGPLPEARHGICAGVIDGKIHLVSGGRHPRVSVSGIHRVLEVAPRGR